MHDDIFEALTGLFGEIAIDPDTMPAGVAASPFGLHLLHEDARYLNTQARLPFGD